MLCEEELLYLERSDISLFCVSFNTAVKKRGSLPELTFLRGE
jgi:hypothetical protein